MARTELFSGFRSPPCKVHMAGFTSDTWTMQREGWECSIEQYPYNDRNRVTLLARHDKLRLRVAAYVDFSYLWSALHGRNPSIDPDHYPPFEVLDMDVGRYNDPIMLGGIRHHRDVPRFGSFDAEPRFVRDYPLNPNTIWREWETEQLIVEPETVMKHLDAIRKLQTPELQAIRENNRKRELRDRLTERPLAQLIHLAAA